MNMASSKKIKTKEEVISKCIEVHGKHYSYDKIEYKNNRTKMCIICPEHGEFWQNYKNHVTLGKGCPICGKYKIWKTRHESFVPKEKNIIPKYKKCFKLTFDIFLERAREVHGDKYDYSKVEYIDSKTPICIICPKHGEFWQKPMNHLRGYGCKKCGKVYKYTTEEFVDKVNKKYGNKYIYSKVEYVNNKTPICIICPKHGEFWQVPSLHLKGHGCYQCSMEQKMKKFSLTNFEFIRKAREVHGDKYDYSKVEYVNNRTKVCIICPEHGEFWQTPFDHLQGKGCPKCNSSHMENEIRMLLLENDFNFKEQQTFEWLKNKQNLYLDFYLPDYNIAIECQGKQHFKVINHFKGKKGFEERLNNDKLKFNLCKKNNIKILYYTNVKEDYEYFSEVIKDKIKLIKQIVKNYE